MTLQEALHTGKKFSTPALVGAGKGYFTFADFNAAGLLTQASILSTEYIVEEVAFSVDEVMLQQAWDKAREGTRTIGAANNSAFFKRFLATLKAS